MHLIKSGCDIRGNAFSSPQLHAHLALGLAARADVEAASASYERCIARGKKYCPRPLPTLFLALQAVLLLAARIARRPLAPSWDAEGRLMLVRRAMPYGVPSHTALIVNKPRKKVAGVDMPDVEPNPGPPFSVGRTAPLAPLPTIIGTTGDSLVLPVPRHSGISRWDRFLQRLGFQRQIDPFSLGQSVLLNDYPGIWEPPTYDPRVMALPVCLRRLNGRHVLLDDATGDVYSLPVKAEVVDGTHAASVELIDGRYHVSPKRCLSANTSVRVYPTVAQMHTRGDHPVPVLTWVVDE